MRRVSIVFPVVFLCITCMLSGCSKPSGFGLHNKPRHSKKSSSSQSPKSKHHPNHVIIVIAENKNFNEIIGNPDAPYINSLAKKGLLFTNAHGITHPSQPNYLALFSGSTHGVDSDHCLKGPGTPFVSPNLGHELLSHGYTFAGYSESMPYTGFTGCGYGKSVYPDGSPLYARKHNPWVDWQGDGANELPDSVNKTFKAFPSDYSKLPDVAFVIPNEDNEMHNGPLSKSIPRGDRWLKKNMGGYIQWAKKHNSLFILTFDEDDFRKVNQFPMIFVGPMIKGGKYDDYVNHYNVLRTLEYLYGLPQIGDNNAKPITDIWQWN